MQIFTVVITDRYVDMCFLNYIYNGTISPTKKQASCIYRYNYNMFFFSPGTQQETHSSTVKYGSPIMSSNLAFPCVSFV